jgi:outer membrane lipoprotein carrier protein
MKKVIRIIALPLLLISSVSSLNAKFDFTTVSDIVKKVKEKFASVECYTAEFSIESEKGAKKTSRSGTIKSRYPNYLMVDFYNPRGQKIVSNGKTMWLYIPSMNVVAEQDLKDDGGLFTSGSKSGLQRLFTKYHYKFDSKDQPKTEKDGNKYYVLFLQQKESRSGFKTIRLWINEQYFVTKAEGLTSSGKKVTITFTKIDVTKDYPKGIFKFDIPSNAKQIKNPMLSEE